DVFYTSAEGLADTPIWTQTALDAVGGKLSQQKVLCNVNYIVPGHGAMFAVTPQMRNFYQCQNAQRVSPVRRAQPFVLPPIQQSNVGGDLASNCAQNVGLCNNPTYFQLMSRNCCRTCNRCGLVG
ncbi:Protein C03F11.2, partial [Aphelenchoides avenae]